MRKNTETLVLIILTTIILGIAFYWYELRPFQIRSECNNKVLNNRLYHATDAEVNDLQGDMVKINSLEREKSDFYYKDCLRDNGLKD